MKETAAETNKTNVIVSLQAWTAQHKAVERIISALMRE